MTRTRRLAHPWTASLAILALLLALVPAVAAADDDNRTDPSIVALFDFEGDTQDPAEVASSFEVSEMSVARGSVTFPQGSGGSGTAALSTTQWHDDDQYFEFVVTPPAEGVELTEFAFQQNRSNTGPSEWTVSLVDDLDGTPQETKVGAGTTTTSFSSRSVDLAGEEERTEPFAVRIRGFDASGSGGTWRIDDVALSRATDADPPGDAFTIASFDFEGATQEPSEVASSFEVSEMSVARGSVTFPQGSGGSGTAALSTNQWHEDDQYFEFVVTPPDAGVTLTSFDFDQNASGTGPEDWALFVVDDLGGSQTEREVGAGTTTTSFSGSSTRSVDLSALDSLGRDEPFALRLRASNASGSSGTWRIDDVTLRGVDGGQNPPLDPVTVALFDFEGGTTEPSAVHPAFEVTAMAAARGATNFVAGNPGSAFTTTQWHEGDNYFEFVVTPPDEGVDPTTFGFDQNASGTGPTTWSVTIVDDLDGDPVETELDSGDASTSWGSRSVDLSGDDLQRTEPFAMRIRGDGASGAGGTWRIDNVELEGSTTADAGEIPLGIACQAPQTITEGFAASDGAFVDGKAITAIADGGTGDYSFSVAAVTPDPAAGEVTISQVDGAEAEARFSDEVPGLDPIDSSGTYTVTIEVTDDADVSAACDADVRVVPLLDIGSLRGSVPDDADGRQHVSPYALGSPIFNPGPPVAVRGVVTQRTLEENAPGFDFHGFFLQSLDADPDTIDGFDEGDPVFADGDATTSDGVWVSTGTFPTARTDQDPWAQYTPEQGDIVTLRGPVVEDFQQTVVQNPFVVDVVTPDASGGDLATDIEVVEADPPDDVQAASVYWERIAGMQVEVPADSIVISGNDHFAPSTSEFWVIRGDHPVAQRPDTDARRVFRDYHPLSNSPTDLSEGPGDQNAFRILLGSFGIKALEGDATATITPVRSGDTLDESARGGLYFAFDKYQVMVDSQVEVTRGPDPAASSLGVVDGFDPDSEYSVMVYNVENLYDFRSDPFSGCDLDPDVVPDGQMPTSTCTADETGGSTVSQPFTYAHRSQEAYDAHRIAIAEQILVALEAPDIITIQEAEKQDVCVPVFDDHDPADSFMDCDLSAPAAGETMANTTRGSGAPDTIEELGLEIFRLSDGEIRYEASGDAVNGRDVRGITQGFLHRTDRVELVSTDDLDDDPILGAGDAIDIPYPSADSRTDVAPWVLEAANPKSVNAQLPQSAIDAAGALGESIDGGRFPQTRYAFSRGVQVGLFRIYPDGVENGGAHVDRYITSNHMSAGPDGRTIQRTEQARLNAAVAEAARDHGGQVLATGDFNVFPRPDDPYPAFKTDPDRDPTDQLAPLYDRGLSNLHDVIIDEAPANTYSFIFRGISQILDHIFVDEATLEELVIARFIHVNTDFPANTPGFEPGRGASDHDPLYARFLFEVVPEPPVEVCVTFDRGDMGWNWNSPVTMTKDGITVTNPAGTHDNWTWTFADGPLDVTEVTVFSNGGIQQASTTPGVLTGRYGSNLQWARFCFEVTAG